VLCTRVWRVGRDERLEHTSIHPETVQVSGWIDAPQKTSWAPSLDSPETEVMDTGATSHRKAVIQRELTWHEQEAHGRYSLDAFLYDPPALDAVVQPAIEYLHGNTGELVLDMGCGEGKETLELASRGLHVVSTDLSRTQLSRARELVRRKVPDGTVYFVQANAEELPFAGEGFRIIYGKAILHHLDLDISFREVNRLLEPNGRATFAEPMAQHPLFWLARRLTPKLRTQDERPVILSELERFSNRFRFQELEVHFLFAPCAYLFRIIPKGERVFRKMHSFLSKLDTGLFRNFRAVRRFAWYGVIRVQK